MPEIMSGVYDAYENSLPSPRRRSRSSPSLLGSIDDVLSNRETALDVLGLDDLKMIATELVMKVRENTSIDWQHKESARIAV